MTEKRLQRKLAKIRKNGEQQKQIRELEDMYSVYMPEKKTRKVSNMMLVVIIVAIVGYALANFWLQFSFGIEISPTLTGCWFSFWGAEIVALAAIKTSKVKNTMYDDNELC